MPRPLITLTTDFGESSPYVAQMKGAILSVNRDVELVDVTHGIQPQCIRHGAIVLADSWRCFPPETIHLVVVDPGVGTDRALVCAKCGEHQFVLPDNGLLSAIMQTERITSIFALTNSRYHRRDGSNTFHGRDIMGPVAAHLSLGVEPDELGRPHPELAQLDLPQPKVEAGRLVGEVILIDSFGNLITNIDQSLVDAACQGLPEVWFAERLTQGPCTTYAAAAAGTVVSLFGSSRRLEIAVVDGNAAKVLSASTGDEVVLRW